MGYSIYYHRDFDGIASAVLVMKWLKAAGAAEEFQLAPVDYDSPWVDLRLPYPSVVVDFMYHPDALHFWDHHRSPFTVPLWQQDYELRRARGAAGFCWNPDYPSCAALILDDLPNLQGDPLARELTHWATLIDSAAYDSPDTLFASREPAIELNLALAEGNDDFFNALVRALTEAGLESVSNDPQTRARIVAARNCQSAELAILEQRLQVWENVVVVADLSDTELKYSRYAPYYFAREALYSVVLHRTPDHFKVLCMRNPWIEFESYDLGSLCQRFGGGGHLRVGAALFRFERLNEARDALTHISDTLTKDAKIKAPMANATI